MGIYTKFELNVYLEPDTPKGILDALKYLETKDWSKTANNERMKISVGDRPTFHEIYPDLPNILHTFWNESRVCNFHVKISNLALHVDADIKNYNEEIEKFLDFISPHVASARGTYKFENDDCESEIVYDNEEKRFNIYLKIR